MKTGISILAHKEKSKYLVALMTCGTMVSSYRAHTQCVQYSTTSIAVQDRTGRMPMAQHYYCLCSLLYYSGLMFDTPLGASVAIVVANILFAWYYTFYLLQHRNSRYSSMYLV